MKNRKIMGHFGFSYVGLIFLLALFIPNIIWAGKRPQGYTYEKENYNSFLGIPLAGATLPVIAFFLLGIYGKVIWLLAATIILGVGHIGIHIQHGKN